MNWIKAICVVLALSACCIAEPVTWCSNTNVGIQNSTRFPFRVEGLTFFSVNETSYAKLFITNQSKEWIRNYILVVEFADSNRKHQFSMAFYNLERYRGRSLNLPLGPWVFAHSVSQNDGLKPHSKSVLVTETPIITTRCPRSASISYARLTYSDGISTEDKDQPRIEPVLAEEQHLSGPALAQVIAQTPIIHGSFQIADGGQVDGLDLSPEQAPEIPPAIVEQLKRFKFSAANAIYPFDLPFILVFVKEERDTELVGRLSEWVTDQPMVEVLVARRSRDRSYWEVSTSTWNRAVGVPTLRVQETDSPTEF
jgi:hypothetical protein